MAKRKTTEQLIAELRLFNHNDAADKIEQLTSQVKLQQDALVTAADECRLMRLDIQEAAGLRAGPR